LTTKALYIHYNTLHHQQQGQPLPSSTERIQNENELDFLNTLANETGMKVISAIPCYCDIQFAKKEFLTALRYPGHPFAKQIQEFTKTIQTMKPNNK
jgi:hypothetical protein